MRRIVKALIIVLIILIAYSVSGMKSMVRHIVTSDPKISCNPVYKGLGGAKDFAADEKGNFFIAFKDKVQVITSTGSSYYAFINSSLNITSMTYNKGILYLASGTKVLSFDLHEKKFTTILDNLPSYGDYKESLLLVRENALYVTIGAATNSGVVGKDNLWLKEQPYYHDLTPKEIILKGSSSKVKNAGAFVPYGSRNYKGQEIPANFPGNASILRIPLDGSSVSTYAWGIRNVKGLDYDTSNTIIAAVGGMEDRGSRPVKGDVDYLFRIKKDQWYGWPDFSGAIRIDDKRFRDKDDNKINLILKKMPSSNIPGPLYRHNHVATIGSVAVDRNGAIGKKNSIYFYDKKDNIIYQLLNATLINAKIEVFKGKITSMKFFNNKLYMLDTEEGLLYETCTSPSKTNNGVIYSQMYYLFVLFVLGMSMVIYLKD